MKNKPAQTVAQLFNEFEQFVIPPNAPNVQRKEMEKAFYSGFFNALTQLMENSELPEDEAILKMDTLFLEAEKYFSDLTK